MTRKRHPCARTDARMRREIQHSEESDRALAARLGINPKTVAKWRRRSATEDLRSGPKQPVSTVLTLAEEALIVVYRRRMRFALDDCFRGLKQAIPHLSRTGLNRCLKRHGLSRVPAGSMEKATWFQEQTRHFTIELYALPPELGGNYLLFAITTFNNFIFAQAVDELSGYATAEFLAELVKRSPVGVSSVETNDHEAFTDAKGRQSNARHSESTHPFRMACRDQMISHLIVPAKNPAAKMVLPGWRGAAIKDYWEVYSASPTEHNWRKARAHYGETRLATLRIAVESEARAEARRKAKGRKESKFTTLRAAAEWAKSRKGRRAEAALAKQLKKIERLEKKVERLLGREETRRKR